MLVKMREQEEAMKRDLENKEAKIREQLLNEKDALEKEQAKMREELKQKEDKMKGDVENMEKLFQERESKLLEQELKSQQQLTELQTREDGISQRESDRLIELEKKRK